ncbi:PREDICTED: exosome complex component RRP41-like [Brassica oleracea var. oleracea]|uniref:exosome complex component RRP41-like n=1 Tax=Brassica oleracea var. oleracea TaxID=109376 RepID=UPI0006A6F636|nr:PREDICTED: exosome complex component RRP41-like [Brassica oleracea var. oleracea]
MADVLSNNRRRRHRERILNDIEEDINKLRIGGLRDMDDVPLWRSEEGKFGNRFSTKKTWHQLRTRQSICPWSRGIWFPESTPKYSFMIWIAIKNRLQTGDKMQAWNATINAECTLCHEVQETCHHLFFQCTYSSKLCCFEMGNTKVIAAVYGLREIQNKSQQKNGHALVLCEYSMAHFNTGDRRRQKNDMRSTEISLVIRQTMEACILTELLPHSQIDIFLQVLQADGGTRSACIINAATLVLADAGVPMRDLSVSCSAGYLNSTPLLDLNYVEDSAGGADVTVGILPKLDKVTLLQMDAKLPMETFETVFALASEGCKAIAERVRKVLQENTKQLEYRRAA